MQSGPSSLNHTYARRRPWSQKRSPDLSRFLACSGWCRNMSMSSSVTRVRQTSGATGGRAPVRSMR